MFVKNYPLKHLTTAFIGGKAALYFRPRDTEELKKELKAIGGDFEIYVLGGGSNTVFGDFKGCVVHLTNLRGFKILAGGDRGEFLLNVGGGTPLKDLIPILLKENLCGLETLLSIPRITVGGAVRMNASAFGGGISQIVEEVEFLDLRTLEVFRLKGERLRWDYRSLRDAEGRVILSVKLRLKRCEKPLMVLLSEYNSLRRKKQPLNLPSAGSTFKNPKGDYAGRLLEEVGLKGYCSKNMLCFSEKHANFLVNAKRRATFSEFLELVNLAKEKVRENFGIDLEEEVKLVFSQ